MVIILCGCSGLEHSEYEKVRRNNAKGEFVYRHHNEYLYPIQTPERQTREKYPWEKSYAGNFAKITKDYFRCKGSSSNPARYDEKDVEKKNTLFDCGGSQKHSLPIKNDKEFIYPVLIDILNYIQEKTQKKVVITCGYRCPIHNTYADNSPFNQVSKHMLGAEVDFYVQGMEYKPEEVVKLIIKFYQNNPSYANKNEYVTFKRYEKSDTNVSVKPWMNQEILIKLFNKQEGRDFDNRHPYPYLSIQVRQDKATNEKVTYSWPKAFNGYKRY